MMGTETAMRRVTGEAHGDGNSPPPPSRTRLNGTKAPCKAQGQRRTKIEGQEEEPHSGGRGVAQGGGAPRAPVRKGADTPQTRETARGGLEAAKTPRAAAASTAAAAAAAQLQPTEDKLQALKLAEYKKMQRQTIDDAALARGLQAEERRHAKAQYRHNADSGPGAARHTALTPQLQCGRAANTPAAATPRNRAARRLADPAVQRSAAGHAASRAAAVTAAKRRVNFKSDPKTAQNPRSRPPPPRASARANPERALRAAAVLVAKAADATSAAAAKTKTAKLAFEAASLALEAASRKVRQRAAAPVRAQHAPQLWTPTRAMQTAPPSKKKPAAETRPTPGPESGAFEVASRAGRQPPQSRAQTRAERTQPPPKETPAAKPRTTPGATPGARDAALGGARQRRTATVAPPFPRSFDPIVLHERSGSDGFAAASESTRALPAPKSRRRRRARRSRQRPQQKKHRERQWSAPTAQQFCLPWGILKGRRDSRLRQRRQQKKERHLRAAALIYDRRPAAVRTATLGAYRTAMVAHDQSRYVPQRTARAKADAAPTRPRRGTGTGGYLLAAPAILAVLAARPPLVGGLATPAVAFAAGDTRRAEDRAVLGRADGRADTRADTRADDRADGPAPVDADGSALRALIAERGGGGGGTGGGGGGLAGQGSILGTPPRVAHLATLGQPDHTRVDAGADARADAGTAADARADAHADGPVRADAQGSARADAGADARADAGAAADGRAEDRADVGRADGRADAQADPAPAADAQADARAAAHDDAHDRRRPGGRSRRRRRRPELKADRKLLHVVIDGSIGTGKSTVLAQLMGEFPEAIIVAEPVGLWEKSGILAGLYDGSLNAGMFQLAALSTIVAADADAHATARSRGADLMISERAPASTQAFAAATLTGLERTAYDVSYAALARGEQTARVLHIFLDAPLELLQKRIAGRGRAAEQRAADADDGACVGGISVAYLAKLAGAYEDLYASIDAPTVRVDASAPAAHVAAEVVALIRAALDAKGPREQRHPGPRKCVTTRGGSAASGAASTRPSHRVKFPGSGGGSGGNRGGGRNGGRGRGGAGAATPPRDKTPKKKTRSGGSWTAIACTCLSANGPWCLLVLRHAPPPWVRLLIDGVDATSFQLGIWPDSPRGAGDSLGLWRNCETRQEAERYLREIWARSHTLRDHNVTEHDIYVVGDGLRELAPRLPLRVLHNAGHAAVLAQAGVDVPALLHGATVPPPAPPTWPWSAPPPPWALAGAQSAYAPAPALEAETDDPQLTLEGPSHAAVAHVASLLNSAVATNAPNADLANTIFTQGEALDDIIGLDPGIAPQASLRGLVFLLISLGRLTGIERQQALDLATKIDDTLTTATTRTNGSDPATTAAPPTAGSTTTAPQLTTAQPPTTAPLSPPPPTQAGPPPQPDGQARPPPWPATHQFAPPPSPHKEPPGMLGSPTPVQPAWGQSPPPTDPAPATLGAWSLTEQTTPPTAGATTAPAGWDQATLNATVAAAVTAALDARDRAHQTATATTTTQPPPPPPVAMPPSPPPVAWPPTPPPAAPPAATTPTPPLSRASSWHTAAGAPPARPLPQCLFGPAGICRNGPNCPYPHNGN